MTKLNTLKDIDSREAAKMLAALSSSLLPQPGIGKTSIQAGLDSRVLTSVLAEIRQRLKIGEDDFSPSTQSKIYAFLSGEISKAALANISDKSIKDRLGNKGQLRPGQYQVVITDQTLELIETLGSKKQHIIEAITHPDEVVHLQSSYTGEDNDIRPTISIKSIPSKKDEDEFVLLIVSFREGQIQQVETAFRVYTSEVNVRDISNPLDVLKAFVDTYGLIFQLGTKVSKYLENEVLGIKPFSPRDLSLGREMKPVEGSPGDYYYPLVAGAETRVHAPHSEIATVRILLAFVVDITKYARTLRRHKVHSPEERWKFLTI